MPSRSAPTATTSAPYAGSAHASSRACRFVPAPETSTTRRAGERGVSGTPDRLPTGGSAGGPTRWRRRRRPDRRRPSRPWRPRGCGTRSAPTSAIRPGPTAPPASATSDGEQRRRRATPRAEAAHGAGLVAVGREAADHQHRRERRRQHRHRDQRARPGGGVPVGGQRREQRERRHRAEHHRGRRDHRAGADGEAGTEQVGAGQQHGVRGDGRDEQRCRAARRRRRRAAGRARWRPTRGRAAGPRPAAPTPAATSSSVAASAPLSDRAGRLGDAARASPRRRGCRRRMPGAAADQGDREPARERAQQARTRPVPRRGQHRGDAAPRRRRRRPARRVPSSDGPGVLDRRRARRPSRRAGGRRTRRAG